MRLLTMTLNDLIPVLDKDQQMLFGSQIEENFKGIKASHGTENK